MAARGAWKCIELRRNRGKVRDSKSNDPAAIGVRGLQQLLSADATRACREPAAAERQSAGGSFADTSGAKSEVGDCENERVEGGARSC